MDGEGGNKKWLWVAVAIGAVVLVVLATRKGGPTVTTLGGDTDESAILQARGNAFSSLASLVGLQLQSEAEGRNNLALAKIGSDTQLGLAGVQAWIAGQANSLTEALAGSQERIAKIQADASVAASDRQVASQNAAVQSMANAQKRADTMDFISGIVNAGAQIIGALFGGGKGKNPKPGTYVGNPGAGTLVYGTNGRPVGMR